AWMSVCRPVEIDAQPPTCAGVGVSKADSNQARTAGEKGASGSPAGLGGVGALARPARGRVVAVTGRGVYSEQPISIRCSISSAFQARAPAPPARSAGHAHRLPPP